MLKHAKYQNVGTDREGLHYISQSTRVMPESRILYRSATLSSCQRARANLQMLMHEISNGSADATKNKGRDDYPAAGNRTYAVVFE